MLTQLNHTKRYEYETRLYPVSVDYRVSRIYCRRQLPALQTMEMPLWRWR